MSLARIPGRFWRISWMFRSATNRIITIFTVFLPWVQIDVVAILVCVRNVDEVRSRTVFI